MSKEFLLYMHDSLYSHTVRPIYDNTLDYSDLKFIHIPQDLKAQRAIADKENKKLMKMAKMKEIPKPSIPTVASMPRV